MVIYTTKSPQPGSLKFHDIDKIDCPLCENKHQKFEENWSRDWSVAAEKAWKFTFYSQK
jgi:hypothetical protein